MKGLGTVLALGLGAALLLGASHSSVPLIGLPFAGFFATLEPKSDFETMAAELNKKGLKAHAPASIVGKSGVKHEFAFALVPDGARAKIVVDTELSVKDVDEMKVLKFYVKVYDVGPDKALLCVSPRLAERAATLAKEYGISVLEDEVPKRLVPLAEKFVTETAESTV